LPIKFVRKYFVCLNVGPVHKTILSAVTPVRIIIPAVCENFLYKKVTERILTAKISFLFLFGSPLEI
jgi:hypothetical protein